MEPRLALVVVCCFGLAGCANTDILVKKQTEMEARVEQLVQGNTATTTQLAELANQVKELQAQVKANATAVEALKASTAEALKASTAAAAAAAARQETPPPSAAEPTPKIEVVNQDTTPFDKEESVQDAYMKAFGLYSANSYSQAIAAFEGFIAAYPDSEFAGNAQYWIGECFYTQHDYAQALAAFSKVSQKYPKGQKVPDALLKVGLTYVSMNEQGKAQAAFQELIDKYPRSQAAAKARERLDRH